MSFVEELVHFANHTQSLSTEAGEVFRQGPNSFGAVDNILLKYTPGGRVPGRCQCQKVLAQIGPGDQGCDDDF